MKQYEELSRGLKLFINLLFWIPVSLITMTILMRIMPIRMMLDFERISMGWSLPQSVPFGLADFMYIRLSVILSIVFAVGFAVLLSFVRGKSKQWWLSLSIFFVICCLSILLGLYLGMGQWFREYGGFFLDVFLGPVFLLFEFETIHGIRHVCKSLSQ